MATRWRWFPRHGSRRGARAETSSSSWLRPEVEKTVRLRELHQELFHVEAHVAELRGQRFARAHVVGAVGAERLAVAVIEPLGREAGLHFLVLRELLDELERTAHVAA